MRLINVSTFKLEEYNGRGIPEYAILSHTWGEDEISFTEFETPEAQRRARHKAGYVKIRRFCRRAEKDGHRHVWADTVCIDKRNSSELTEAINSMFEWYRGAEVCYAYLGDVSSSNFQQCISSSGWFLRGWTLQELLAPDHLIFTDQDFNNSCSRESVAHSVSTVTGIERDFMGDCNHRVSRIRGQSIAKRMSWAAHRVTTRIEDRAYSLLGIFGINMPLLYGEGEKAFQRLQEEIIKTSDDHSIFAFSLRPHRTKSDSISSLMDSLAPGHYLAPSPVSFADSGDIEPMAYDLSLIDSTVITNRGLQIHLPVLPIRQCAKDEYDHIQHYQIALLNCRRASDGSYVGMMISSRNFKDARHDVSKSLRSRVFYVSIKHRIEATVIVNPDIISRARYATVVLRNIFDHFEIRNLYSPRHTPVQFPWTLCCRYYNFNSEKFCYEKFQLERVDVLACRNMYSFSVMYPVAFDSAHPVAFDSAEPPVFCDYTFRLRGNEENIPPALLLVFKDSSHNQTIELILLKPFPELSWETRISRLDGSGGRSSTEERLQQWRGDWVFLLEGSKTLDGHAHKETTLKMNFAKHQILDQHCIDLEISVEDSHSRNS